jgi:hypothetical protein
VEVSTRGYASNTLTLQFHLKRIMEGAAQKDLEQRLGTARRPVPADSSAGVSLMGLTEHSAENGLESSIAGPWRSKRLKQKASTTSTSTDGARLYPSSVGHVQSGGAGTSQRTATNFVSRHSRD